MDKTWLTCAAERYEECNRLTFEWILSREPLHKVFIDTKVDSLKNIPYGKHSGLRGPSFIYGWIQGRGLESLVTFANYYSKISPAFSKKLFKRAELLFDALCLLYKRDGTIHFLYDSDLKPIRVSESGIVPQTNEVGLFTYADAFAAKGLFVASKFFRPEKTSYYEQYLFDVIDAVEQNRFQMDENLAISLEQIKKQKNDFGPRMILLGAAGLLHEHNHTNPTTFADRFIDYVLENHYCSSRELLLNIPNHDICNVGHAIEFCGFAYEHLLYNPDETKIRRLGSILKNSLEVGLQGPGIALYLSAKSGKATSPYFPWWPMPEAVRACALSLSFEKNQEIIKFWKQADKAFFSNFWQADKSYAFQTCDKSGPVDYVPATPDLDPGYHTGISFLRAINIIRSHLVC